MSPRRTGRSHGRRDDGVFVVEERDVVVLQIEPKVSSSDVEDMVFNGFSAMSRMRPRGGEWLAFIATDATHWAGKTLWLGFTESVPLPAVDAFQGILEKSGLEVERETGRALHHEMIPFARLSDEGLELLVPSALVGSSTERKTIKRGQVEAIRRPYTTTSSAGAPRPSKAPRASGAKDDAADEIDTLIGGSDPLMFAVSKDMLDQDDFGAVGAVIDRAVEEHRVIDIVGRIALFFPEFDSDPREVFEVPEVKSWLRSLEERHRFVSVLLEPSMTFKVLMFSRIPWKKSGNRIVPDEKSEMGFMLTSGMTAFCLAKQSGVDARDFAAAHLNAVGVTNVIPSILDYYEREYQGMREG